MKPWDGAAATALIVGVLSLAAPALAQLSSSPANSKAPLNVSSDSADVVNSKCMTTLSGRAEVVQGDSRIRAHTITIFAKHKGAAPGADGQTSCGGADHVIADGDVFYVTPTQLAHGDHAVYSADAGEIVMTGNVIVVQGKDVARGDRLTIEIATKEAKMDSPKAGGRVKGVFYPDQGTPGLTPPAASDPPAPAH
jgi:lipopolysaccharide export system protein LptA